MQPVAADTWGNVKTWLHTSIGEQLVTHTLDSNELAWRFPMILSAARLWQLERRQAQRRFAAPKRRQRTQRPH